MVSYNRKTVLLLDRNYYPMRAVSWRKAMDLVIGRKVAEIIGFYENAVSELDPSVIRLTERVCPPIVRRKKLKFCRRQVFLRDDWICQYCGAGKSHDLTIDHIIPKCQGGKNTYTNCVTACFNCNQRKAGLTPKQAGMRLFVEPTRPIMGIVLNASAAPNEWQEYLY